MKIKTANIRMLKNATESELKPVKVKEVFTYADDLFFIHRGATKTWTISHFKTGLAVCRNLKTIAKAKEKFQNMMKIFADRLSESVNNMLEKYGTANELPENYK